MKEDRELVEGDREGTRLRPPNRLFEKKNSKNEFLAVVLPL